jgi:hypothetical protein
MTLKQAIEYGLAGGTGYRDRPLGARARGILHRPRAGPRPRSPSRTCEHGELDELAPVKQVQGHVGRILPEQTVQHLIEAVGHQDTPPSLNSPNGSRPVLVPDDEADLKLADPELARQSCPDPVATIEATDLGNLDRSQFVVRVMLAIETRRSNGAIRSTILHADQPEPLLQNVVGQSGDVPPVSDMVAKRLAVGTP